MLIMMITVIKVPSDKKNDGLRSSCGILIIHKERFFFVYVFNFLTEAPEMIWKKMFTVLSIFI